MKKWNFGFVMIGLAFLISILVLSRPLECAFTPNNQHINI